MAQIESFKGYSDPLDVADRVDLPYEERLELLQDWQVALENADAPQEHRDEVRGAIQALEMGAEVQDDEPEAGPEGRPKRQDER